MNISYEYQIANMDVADIDGKNDVVVAIHYRVIAKSDGVDEQPVHSGVVYLEALSDVFTEFSRLTKEQVMQWLKSKLDVDAVERDLMVQLEQIAAQPEPVVTTSKLPAWV